MREVLKVISNKLFHSFNLTDLRKLDLMLKLLLSIFLTLAVTSNIVFSDIFQIGPISERMLKDDILSIEIRPVVENLRVNYSSSNSRGIEIHLYSNRTLGIYYFSEVYIIPRSEGTYDITVEFSSKSPWNCEIGVYTNNYTFYGKYPVLTSLGPFIQLTPPFGVDSKEDNQTVSYRIRIILSVESYEKKPELFPSFKFPTPVNAALFILTSFILAYINAFFILDTYFKSKVEEVSRFRLALICLIILVSLFILYQLRFLMAGEL